MNTKEDSLRCSLSSEISTTTKCLCCREMLEIYDERLDNRLSLLGWQSLCFSTDASFALFTVSGQ